MFTMHWRNFALAASVAVVLAGCSSYGDYGYGRGYSSYRAYAPSSYYGWSGDYYYPGVGIYLYDRGGARHRWNDNQRRYWQGWRGERRENWSGYQGNRGWNANRVWDGDRGNRGRRGRR